MDLYDRIDRIDELISKWFIITGKQEAKPADIERYLVEQQIYPNFKDGWYLREDLRSLELQGKLGMFNHCILERKTRSWTFYAKEEIINDADIKIIDNKKKNTVFISIAVILLITLIYLITK